MKRSTIIPASLALALAGCGVEQASTAAAGAAIKQQEVQQGKKTMEQAQQKVGAAMEQVQDRAAANEQK